MRRYLRFAIPAAGIVFVLVAAMVTLNDNLVFFHTPSEVLNGEVADPEDRFRLGGQVEYGTVADTGDGVEFDLGDGFEAIRVMHRGAPQELFQEGIGVVVEGTWDGDVFRSDTMMVRHDEQYRTEDGVYETPEQGGAAP